MSPELPETISIQLHAHDKKSVGQATVYTPGKGERVRKAVLVGIGLLCAAAVSVFIPLAHFILVPGFLISAIVFSSAALKPKMIIQSGHGKCPACGADFRIMRRKFAESFSDICEKCSREVVVSISAN